MKQLTLNLTLHAEQTFDNFQMGDNFELISSLKKILTSNEFPVIYIWGQQVGRTHLLHACCELAAQKELTTIFFAMKNYQQFTPEILEGLEDIFLICMDDIDAIAKNPQWEEALFHFYNRARAQDARLVFSGVSPAAQLPFDLRDLLSRLTMALSYQVKPIDDAAKLIALKSRANHNGIDLNDDVGNYLLTHCSRGLGKLFEVLDHLDKESLRRQQRLTIPFVKKVLNF